MDCLPFLWLIWPKQFSRNINAWEFRMQRHPWAWGNADGGVTACKVTRWQRSPPPVSSAFWGGRHKTVFHWEAMSWCEAALGNVRQTSSSINCCTLAKSVKQFKAPLWSWGNVKSCFINSSKKKKGAKEIKWHFSMTVRIWRRQRNWDVLEYLYIFSNWPVQPQLSFLQNVGQCLTVQGPVTDTRNLGSV